MKRLFAVLLIVLLAGSLAFAGGDQEGGAIKIAVAGPHSGDLASYGLPTVKAAEILIKEGFEVFPYTTDDLVVAKRLADVGCKIIMPWGSMIGSGKGLMNPDNLIAIRKQFPDLQLVVDAGIGKPSHATQAMELGYDGVLLNSAIALAQDPIKMADAFNLGPISEFCVVNISSIE